MLHFLGLGFIRILIMPMALKAFQTSGLPITFILLL